MDERSPLSPFHVGLDVNALPLPFRDAPFEDWAGRLFGSIRLTHEEAAAYTELFRLHDISLEDWDGLTYDLLHEIGINKIGHRVRILKRMKELYYEQVSKSARKEVRVQLEEAASDVDEIEYTSQTSLSARPDPEEAVRSPSQGKKRKQELKPSRDEEQPSKLKKPKQEDFTVTCVDSTTTHSIETQHWGEDTDQYAELDLNVEDEDTEESASAKASRIVHTIPRSDSDEIGGYDDAEDDVIQMPEEEEIEEKYVDSRVPSADLTHRADAEANHQTEKSQDSEQRAPCSRAESVTEISKVESAQMWSSAIKKMKTSTIGIHYQNNQSGECPYKFTTAGMLPWARTGPNIWVLMAETDWNGNPVLTYFSHDRAGEDERPERTAMLAIQNATLGIVNIRNKKSERLINALSDARTLRMFYSQAHCVFFAPETSFFASLPSKLRQQLSTLDSGASELYGVHWVHLADLCAGLKDPQGRIVLGKRDLHLHPQVVAFLTNSFAHEYLTKIERESKEAKKTQVPAGPGIHPLLQLGGRPPHHPPRHSGARYPPHQPHHRHHDRPLRRSWDPVVHAPKASTQADAHRDATEAAQRLSRSAESPELPRHPSQQDQPHPHHQPPSPPPPPQQQKQRNKSAGKSNKRKNRNQRKPKRSKQQSTC